MRHRITVFIDGQIDASVGKTKLFHALKHFNDPSWVSEDNYSPSPLMDFGTWELLMARSLKDKATGARETNKHELIVLFLGTFS